MILMTLKKDWLTARKEKLSRAVPLSTLVSEIEMVGKNEGRAVTDEDCVKVITKFIKGVRDSINALRTGDPRIIDLLDEERMYKLYLPAQMSEDELSVAIIEIASDFDLSGPKALGLVLKELKVRFAGKYDGAMAAKVAKEVL